VILGIYDMIWKYCLKITGNRPWLAEEYVHVAVVALCEQFNRFELERGLRYSTYAMYWVDQSVKRHIMNCSRLVRVPIHHQRSDKKSNTARERFHEDVDRANKISRLTAEHEADLADHRGGEMLHADAVREFLQKSLRFLHTNEQEVVKLRWQEKTLDEVGQSLKLSKERIRQIERQAYKKIRQFAPMIDRAIAEEMECVA
jgi:RNA polymerase sigma factor (sigma-70 family)